MPTLQDKIPENTKSFLISGGLKPDGKSFILDREQELRSLRKQGNYRFNSHVGFVDDDEIETMAELVDYISFDFVSDADVIKRVYHIDRTVDEYIALYKRLKSRIATYPHITIGLDAGRIHWEYEAVKILHDLGADRLVLNVLVPTPGTKFENVPNPDLDEVRKVFQHAREIFHDGLLIVGCMRPKGEYRNEMDLMAIETGVDRIVQPTINAREMAEKLGREISYLYECCALDPSEVSRQTSEFERVTEEKKSDLVVL